MPQQLLRLTMLQHFHDRPGLLLLRLPADRRLSRRLVRATGERCAAARACNGAGEQDPKQLIAVLGVCPTVQRPWPLQARPSLWLAAPSTQLRSSVHAAAASAANVVCSRAKRAHLSLSYCIGRLLSRHSVDDPHSGEDVRLSGPMGCGRARPNTAAQVFSNAIGARTRRSEENTFSD
jgi:hypothetical protein